jgi:hypothetical protein
MDHQQGNFLGIPESLKKKRGEENNRPPANLRPSTYAPILVISQVRIPFQSQEKDHFM